MPGTKVVTRLVIRARGSAGEPLGTASRAAHGPPGRRSPGRGLAVRRVAGCGVAVRLVGGGRVARVGVVSGEFAREAPAVGEGAEADEDRHAARTEQHAVLQP